MNAKSELLRVKKDWEGCTRCSLSQIRPKDSHVVFGWGAIPADYLFVYDAPSEEETHSGVPLVGRYGDVLEKVIEDAEFASGSWAITPTVGCRPYFVLPATEDVQEQVRDRDPADEELDACASRLTSVIYHIDPRVIIAVGAVPWERLVRPKDRGEYSTFESACGNLFVATVQGVRDQVLYPLVPIPSPKKIIANPSSAKHGPVAVTANVLKKIQYYVNQLKRMEEKK